MNDLPIAAGAPRVAPATPAPPATPAASRGKIITMAAIAGAVVTNIYCTHRSCR
nr:hypothetical protein [Burkholderia gladioli]